MEYRISYGTLFKQLTVQLRDGAIRCRVTRHFNAWPLQASSTALRFMSSFTSMYFCVTEMLRCPAKLASTRTPMPLLAKLVMNVRRPEWLLAPDIGSGSMFNAGSHGYTAVFMARLVQTGSTRYGTMSINN